MTGSNSVELFDVEFFLTEKQTSKVEILLFWGFVPPTHFQKQVGWGTWLASEALTTFWWAQAKDKDKTPNYCRLMKLNLFSYPNSNLEEQWYSLYRYRYWCYTIQSIQKFNSLQKWKYFEILFCMFWKFSWFCFIQVWKWKALSPNSDSEMWMKISFTYEWFFYEIKEHWDQSMYRHHSNVWNQCFCSNPWSLWLRVRLFIWTTSSQYFRRQWWCLFGILSDVGWDANCNKLIKRLFAAWLVPWLSWWHCSQESGLTCADNPQESV